VWEASFGQAFLAHPKSMTVIGQDFDRRGPTITEDKYRTLERVLIQLYATDTSQTINALTEISGLSRHQDAHMWGQLHHE
jgi:hypothetical protein